MNEKGFWSRWVKPVLHDPANGWVAWKVQDAFNAGLPDVFWRGPWGGGGVIEMKYQPEVPVRESTPCTIAVTSEQRRHLKQWGGEGLYYSKRAAFVLYGLAEWCYLLVPGVPERVMQRDLGSWSVAYWHRADMKDRLRDALYAPGIQNGGG